MVDNDTATDLSNRIGSGSPNEVGDIGCHRQDGIEGRADHATDQAEHLYVEAKDAVRQAAGEIADHAEGGFRKGERHLREAHERSAEWPHAALLVAALVGFGFGLLISRH